jgi:hypothetical protein
MPGKSELTDLPIIILVVDFLGETLICPALNWPAKSKCPVKINFRSLHFAPKRPF